MKWIELKRKGDIALLQNDTDTRYAVVSGYNPKASGNPEWDGEWYYFYDKSTKEKCLQNALKYFEVKAEKRLHI